MLRGAANAVKFWYEQALLSHTYVLARQYGLLQVEGFHLSLQWTWQHLFSFLSFKEIFTNNLWDLIWAMVLQLPSSIKNSQENINFSLKKLGVLQNYTFKTHPANATPILTQHISCGSPGHWGILTGQDSHYSTPDYSGSEPDLVSSQPFEQRGKRNQESLRHDMPSHWRIQSSTDTGSNDIWL